jgi:hypothetical protein
MAFASFAEFEATVEASGFRFFPLGRESRTLPDLMAWCDDWAPKLIVTEPSLIAPVKSR